MPYTRLKDVEHWRENIAYTIFSTSTYDDDQFWCLFYKNAKN